MEHRPNPWRAHPTGQPNGLFGFCSFAISCLAALAGSGKPRHQDRLLMILVIGVLGYVTQVGYMAKQC